MKIFAGFGQLWRVGGVELKQLRGFLFGGDGEWVFGEQVSFWTGDRIEKWGIDVCIRAEIESNFKEASLEISGFDYLFPDVGLIKIYLSLLRHF